MRERLQRQVEGLEAEIALLSEDADARRIDLSSGQRDESSSGPGGVYSFVMDDAQPLPEDGGGTLRVGDTSLSAYIIGQEGNRLWVLVETADALPSSIPSARLELAAVDLLQKLKERIEEMLADGDFGLAPEVFGERDATVSMDTLPSRIIERVDDDSMRAALEQALGSKITFLWGPPGTGKTYAIAAMTARLSEAGETVFVTSHTHAAVEQALWSLVQPSAQGREPGLLHGSALVDAGRILKVGATRDPKIPKECQFDAQLEMLAEENRANIDELMRKRERVGREQATRREHLKKWDTAQEARQALAGAAAKRRRAEETVENVEQQQGQVRQELQTAKQQLAKSENSVFFLRRWRVEQAQEQVRRAKRRVEDAETQHANAVRHLNAAQASEEQAREAADVAATATAGLRDKGSLLADLRTADAELSGIQHRIEELRKAEEEFATRLLDGATALFATLTKLYMSPQLRERQWDTVIVDEASMAMPPLVAFAASRARKRVVVVGDFYQLPPIVQSREGSGQAELGVDLFDLRGIPQLVREGGEHSQLTRLRIQRRMRPGIAETARTLAYKSELVDHPDTSTRPVPEWCTSTTAELLSGKRRPDETGEGLLVVDIAKLEAWAGKSKGTTSRFNFYSAQACVELAALYASRMPRPDPGAAPPIGIITPYAAQRRYLTRLVHTLGLEAWMTVGTVHTFQGNECDLIVFDSVLAYPHYTARLTDPHVYEEVRRDLNVAVTRARHQLVFVGDGSWLDQHAKAGSGYGTLWAHLKQVAPIVDAADALGERFHSRVASHMAKTFGWGSVEDLGNVMLLDEQDFYTAFIADLEAAKEQVVLYTPYIGKQRWAKMEPHITAAAEGGVEVVLVHKPLTDDAWKSGDSKFGKVVFDRLARAGVILIPLSGVHAKTIVIDEQIVYEGSLNWASQVASYEHMLRIDSRELAAVHIRLLQQRDFIASYRSKETENDARACPNCGGPLMVINQRREKREGDRQPMKLGCVAYYKDKSCHGHLRGVDERAPFRQPPKCEQGTVMKLKYNKNGKPHAWTCGHKECSQIRFRRGDVKVPQSQQ